MGFIKKSIFILLVALSTPLLYRKFATEDTVKFMSSYYSNYKTIDRFLRQSASQLDKAKDYLPDQQKINSLVEDVKSKVETLVNKAKSSSPSATKPDASTTVPTRKATDESKIRMTNCPSDNGESVRLWSKEELIDYDGSHDSIEEIYLGFLGIVYNVTINAQHYGPGAEYNAFAGRDATRAFITGNFTHDLTDDLLGIEESYYSHIESWASFYSTSYQILGLIEGAFYDQRGCGTQNLKKVYETFNKLAEQRARQQEQNKLLPECNSEWNSDLKSGRVWCTTKSGGVERDWVGVPRLIEDQNESSRCVCVNIEGMNPSQQAQFRVYADCDPNASECPIN